MSNENEKISNRKCVCGTIYLIHSVLSKIQITIIMTEQVKDFVVVAIVAILTSHFIKLG